MATRSTDNFEALVARVALRRLVGAISKSFGVPAGQMRLLISEAPLLGAQPYGADYWAAALRRKRTKTRRARGRGGR